MIQNYNLSDFNYELPESKIAFYPVEKRDESKLLIYKNEEIQEDIFKNIAACLPNQSLIVFNNSKVIPARLLFTTQKNYPIEIFCLEPLIIDKNYEIAINQNKETNWRCLVKNLRKWKEEILQLKIGDTILEAHKIKIEAETVQIHFSWNMPDLTFQEILNLFGNIPLPPYIKRETHELDLISYQTIFAQNPGSVAAPTAGLHFTEFVFKSFAEKNMHIEYLQLHVGSGTFKPIKSKTINEHVMHQEYISFSITTIENIILHINCVIAVGTTSLRTLETMYWLGIMVLENQHLKEESLFLLQWEAYRLPQHYSVLESMNALKNWMLNNQCQNFLTTTKLFITPDYKCRMVRYLITNFHQPCSSLILIIAAITKEKWKSIYDYALKNDFRFLSYGDACLFEVN